MSQYQNLRIWQKSVDLTVEIYELTKNFPNNERYGIVSQMQRASVSVPSNIAEGAIRQHKKEFINFLYIGLGSLSELNTQVIITQKIGYINDFQCEKLKEEIDEIGKQISGLINKLKIKMS